MGLPSGRSPHLRALAHDTPPDWIRRTTTPDLSESDRTASSDPNESTIKTHAHVPCHRRVPRNGERVPENTRTVLGRNDRCSRRAVSFLEGGCKNLRTHALCMYMRLCMRSTSYASGQRKMVDDAQIDFTMRRYPLCRKPLVINISPHDKRS